MMSKQQQRLESNLRVFHTWTSGQVSLRPARDQCRLSLHLLRNANYDHDSEREGEGAGREGVRYFLAIFCLFIHFFFGC